MLYSTGSSSDMTFSVSVSTSPIIPRNVVDLPEPVGPEIKIIPYGSFTIRLMVSRFFFEIPLSASVRTPLLVSKILITTFSPWLVGNTETRKSILRSSKVAEKRPSCGLRRSSNRIEERIFTRATTAICTFFGSSRLVARVPSTRNRTPTLPGLGSIWMSEALPSTAYRKIVATIFVTGASSSMCSIESFVEPSADSSRLAAISRSSSVSRVSSASPTSPLRFE